MTAFDTIFSSLSLQPLIRFHLLLIQFERIKHRQPSHSFWFLGRQSSSLLFFVGKSFPLQDKSCEDEIHSTSSWSGKACSSSSSRTVLLQNFYCRTALRDITTPAVQTKREFLALSLILLSLILSFLFARIFRRHKFYTRTPTDYSIAILSFTLVSRIQ